MPPTPQNPLRALSGTRTRGHLDEPGEGRPTRTLGRWREVAAGLSGFSVLALGGLAAAHYTRRVPAQTPIRDRDRVTVAWTERASLLGHPAALMAAAAAAADGDFEVVLKREEVSEDDDAASLVTSSFLASSFHSSVDIAAHGKLSALASVVIFS